MAVVRHYDPSMELIALAIIKPNCLLNDVCKLRILENALPYSGIQIVLDAEPELTISVGEFCFLNLGPETTEYILRQRIR